MLFRTIPVAAALLGLAVGSVHANLLNNPGFEVAGTQSEDARHWKMHDPDDHGDAWGTAIRVDWRAREGRYIGVVRGAWAGMGEYGGFWQEAAVMPGAMYRATAWFWADGAWRAETQEMKLEFWNSERTEILGSETVALHDIGEIWVQKEIEGVAPEGAAWARIVINASGTGDTGSVVEADPISIRGEP